MVSGQEIIGMVAWSEFRAIERIRNDVAHANNYAVASNKPRSCAPRLGTSSSFAAASTLLLGHSALGVDSASVAPPGPLLPPQGNQTTFPNHPTCKPTCKPKDPQCSEPAATNPSPPTP